MAVKEEGYTNIGGGGDFRSTQTDYNDIGGLELQMQELKEAIALPITHADKFVKIGIKQPKGVLPERPLGTGKTLMAPACVAETNATFLKLAGPQLVQMFIGDGAKLVRDAFKLVKEKALSSSSSMRLTQMDLSNLIGSTLVVDTTGGGGGFGGGGVPVVVVFRWWSGGDG
ncbi:26S proteasome regulatory subunit 6A homolog isoform X2 [Papaver somniferum]|uniref:26S proteasome regulatory subunit 6A homolog isoform X2 n=1 Tax=Papaver somniferum TaxID=3469 RepID=UPI000E704E58|nr:26S proteasome regulatory subunit 6A homolog isoform X2 [Papaver somniferum]